MGIHFGDGFHIWFYLRPESFSDVIGEDDVITDDGGGLASEEIDGGSIDDCSVRFELNWLALTLIGKLDPSIFLHFFTDVDAVEVSRHALIGVEAAVDVEFILEDDCCMIGSRGYVLALDFDFCPSGIKGVLQLRLHHDIRGLSIYQASFLLVTVLSRLHRRYIKNIAPFPHTQGHQIKV